MCVQRQLGKLYACGKCPECLSELRSQWSIRLKVEAKAYGSDVHFVTLTYDDNNVPKTDNGYLTLRKTDLQKFLKRLRKHYNENPIAFYACGEYGDNTQRPHYHLIIFGLRGDVSNYVRKSWKLGFVSVEPVTDARMHYVTKYITNISLVLNKECEPPFVLCRPVLEKKQLKKVLPKECFFATVTYMQLRTSLLNMTQYCIYYEKISRCLLLEEICDMTSIYSFLESYINGTYTRCVNIRKYQEFLKSLPLLIVYIKTEELTNTLYRVILLKKLYQCALDYLCHISNVITHSLSKELILSDFIPMISKIYEILCGSKLPLKLKLVSLRD